MMKHMVATTYVWFAIASLSPIYGQQQIDNTLGNLWQQVEENYPGIGVKKV